MRADLINIRDCECPEDHSITKLGHCRTCPYWRIDGDDTPMNVDSAIDRERGRRARGARLAAERKRPLRVIGFTCGDRPHPDGTPCNYDWATYADDFESYGVCSCGQSSRYNPMTDAFG